VLARWSSWGALPQLFDEAKNDWARERAQLKDLLSDASEASMMSPSSKVWLTKFAATIFFCVTSSRRKSSVSVLTRPPLMLMFEIHSPAAE